MKAELAQAAELLRRAGLVAVLSGAGASKESGIPTFREAQTGLWARYDPGQLATPAAFRTDPQLVWDWYEYRRDLVRGARPNPGHHAVAELERWVSQVVVLTQNVDGLHQAAGSTDVVELHGNILRTKCASDCRSDPTVIDLASLPAEEQEASPPCCPHCGDYLRPDVVWFGEDLPMSAIGRAYQVSAACDAMVVVGTSGVVYPAAILPAVARDAGTPVIEVNPEPSGITDLATVFLQGRGGDVLPQLVAALRSQKG
jgi:NAD-dependent deacetylase